MCVCVWGGGGLGEPPLDPLLIVVIRRFTKIEQNTVPKAVDRLRHDHQWQHR